MLLMGLSPATAADATAATATGASSTATVDFLSASVPGGGRPDSPATAAALQLAGVALSPSSGTSSASSSSWATQPHSPALSPHNAITAAELAGYLAVGKPPLLVLDVRPPWAFQQRHILGSHNVHVPPLPAAARRVFPTGGLVFPTEAGASAFRERAGHMAVVVDDRGFASLAPPGASADAARVLCAELAEDRLLAGVLALAEGIDTFARLCPQWCTGPTTTAPTTTAAAAAAAASEPPPPPPLPAVDAMMTDAPRSGSPATTAALAALAGLGVGAGVGTGLPSSPMGPAIVVEEREDSPDSLRRTPDERRRPRSFGGLLAARRAGVTRASGLGSSALTAGGGSSSSSGGGHLSPNSGLAVSGGGGLKVPDDDDDLRSASLDSLVLPMTSTSHMAPASAVGPRPLSSASSRLQQQRHGRRLPPGLQPLAVPATADLRPLRPDPPNYRFLQPSSILSWLWMVRAALAVRTAD
jgi:rhodanese-related sulfurtransferase